jgi:hypothetical protein|tara:strand:+ start:34 stop:564 length:531 start_codon:yes stop_codon:yes gene_type:complete
MGVRNIMQYTEKQDNLAKNLLAKDSRKPIIYSLSNLILNLLNKPFIKLGNTNFPEVPSMEIVKKIVLLLPKNKKFKRLLKGYFHNKEEFKLKIYSELYKLKDLKLISCTKYKKYTLYKITNKGVEQVLPIAQNLWNEEIQETKEGLEKKVKVLLEKLPNGKVLVSFKATINKESNA